MIGFFGMGLLGSNFVRALRERGEEVQVWNRTADKATALEAIGARAKDDPVEAARGCSRIHLVLSDDAAVDGLLARIEDGLPRTIRIIDHTTTSPSGAKARTERLAAKGLTFVHAPVFMGPQNARERTGVMMLSASKALYDELAPALSAMTGKLVHVGEAPDAAAALKLLGNAFLMFLTAGLADVFTLGQDMGVAPEKARELFSFFNPGATIGARADRMLSGAFDDVSWALSMARKDARLMMEAAAQGPLPLHVLPTIAARMDEVIADGHGARDWTVIGKDAVKTVSG